MGGLFLVLAALLAVGLFGELRNPLVPAAMVGLAALAALGAADDWTKLRKNPRGLSVFQKLLLQVLAGYVLGFAVTFTLLFSDPEHATQVIVPFVGSYDLGVAYPTFVMFVVVLCSNAVNITDGMDGLAAGSLTIALFAYAAVSYIAGRSDFTAYLEIPYVRSAAEMTVVCTACFGACLGFLWFNSYPAQVFMGDSGSLPLGGTLGMVACVTKQEAMLFFVGSVFLVEVTCSFLQILWFKLTRRRLFPIAPPHHIYQMRGMHEVKITTRFLILQGILSIVALATLKLH
jgi:phospho-N-acetylmuramoyl-pentapeptide-transferase